MESLEGRTGGKGDLDHRLTYAGSIHEYREEPLRQKRNLKRQDTGVDRLPKWNSTLKRLGLQKKNNNITTPLQERSKEVGVVLDLITRPYYKM